MEINSCTLKICVFYKIYLILDHCYDHEKDVWLCGCQERNASMSSVTHDHLKTQITQIFSISRNCKFKPACDCRVK